MGEFGVWGLLLLIAALSVAGVHVAYSLLISATLGIYLSMGAGPALNLLQQTALHGIREYHYAVIPLFTAMGLLIARSGAAADLFNLANRGLRRVPGRLAVATVAGNAMFAAVTGVGVAAAAAFSQIAYPLMRAQGYHRSFAIGSVAGSSVLGLLIPPSILIIIWAVLTEQSIGRLFAAGVGPGLLLALLFAVYCVIRVTINPGLAPEPSAEARALAETGKVRADEAVGWVGVLLLIIVTLGAIWFGFATPTEAAAIGMLGAALLAWAKGLSLAGQFEAIAEAGRSVAPILLLMLAASLYARFLALEDVPGQIGMLLEQMGLGYVGTLLFFVAIWFVLGTFVDSISIMLLTVPLFWPIAQAMGYPPITFALIGILVIEAGILTPPLGLGVFVVKTAVPDPDVTLWEIFRGAMPYWMMMLLVAYLIYLWPPLAEWLPSLM